MSRDLTGRRPLALVAAVGGVVAAASTLVVCLAIGVVGWYLADGGAHGTPTDALRAGSLGWLSGHFSGVAVQGVHLSAVPLGLTAVVAWTIWRVGLRVGAAVSGHGPDALTIVDGERDLIVPLATGLLTLGYVVTAVLVASLAATAATAPSTARVAVASVVLCGLVGGTAIAVGSGRAAIWVAAVPSPVRVAARVARSVLLLTAGVSLLAFVIALLVDLTTAANVLSQLHADTGASVMILALSVLLVPNAMLFSGAYLLGPGFTVGTGTVVTPAAAVLGPLPMFPLLAALPDEGPAPAWTGALLAVPPLLAFVATVVVQRRTPTARWDEGAVSGLAGGILAGVLVAVAARLAGGSVGPGRLRHVGPFAGEVLVHAVVAFGVGGLLGGLAVTWWHRRSAPVAVTMDEV